MVLIRFLRIQGLAHLMLGMRDSEEKWERNWALHLWAGRRIKRCYKEGLGTFCLEALNRGFLISCT